MKEEVLIGVKIRNVAEFGPIGRILESRGFKVCYNDLTAKKLSLRYIFRPRQYWGSTLKGYSFDNIYEGMNLEPDFSDMINIKQEEKICERRR